MNSDFARGAVRGAAQSRLVTWPAITSPRSRTDLGAILTKFFRDFEAIPRAYDIRNEALSCLRNSAISLLNLAAPHLVIRSVNPVTQDSASKPLALVASGSGCSSPADGVAGRSTLRERVRTGGYRRAANHLESPEL